MTGDRKNIDRLIRQGLRGYREQPPVHAWSRLNSSLDAQAKGKKMFFYRLVAASFLILMAFGAGYFYAVNFQGSVNVAEKGTLQDPGPIESSDVFNNDEQTQIDPENIIIESEPANIGNNIDQTSLADNNNTASENTDNTFVSDLSSGELVAASVDEEVEPKNRMLQGSESKTDNLNTLAFIDLNQVQINESLVQEKKNLFASSSSSDLFIGYKGIVPYDFEKELDVSKKTLALGAQFAPTYSYREISSNYGTNSGGDQDNLNNAEDALRSYAGGVNVDYNFSGKWSIQSGMYFSRIGQVNNDALQFELKNNEFLLAAINTSTGNIDIIIEKVPESVKKIVSPKDTIDFDGVSGVKVIQNFDLFEVPLLIKYKVLDRKFSIHFTGGLSPAYLVDNSTTLEFEDYKYDIGDAGNLNSMIVNTSLGMGLEYLITRKFSVNLEPTFKYALNPINSGSNFNYHPYYFSLFTGVRLKIN